MATETNPNDVAFSGAVTFSGGVPTHPTQSANTVFAGPTSGGAAVPAYRALVAADVPSLDASKIGSGTLSTARGGTGLTSFGGTNQIMYTSSANTIATITTANSSVLVTNGSGAPSWSTTLPAVSGANLTGLSGSSIGTGTVAVAYGGTGLNSFTAGDFLYASGTTTFSKLAAGTAAQVLIGGTTPSWSRTIASGTITTSDPLTITQTWNSSGVTFNGLLLNATDTASAAASTLFDFQVGGSSKLKLDKAGTLYGPASGDFTIRSIASGTDMILTSANGAEGLRVKNGGDVAITSGNFKITGGSKQLWLETAEVQFGRSTTNTAYLRCDSTTSTAPGFEFQGKSTTTSGRKVGTCVTAWATATDASRAGRLIFNASDASADRECLRIESNGTAAMLGFYGAIATAKQTVSGSRGANAALASLLTAMATLGLITDSSS